MEDHAAEALAGHPALDALWVVPRRKWRAGLRSPRTVPATLHQIIDFGRRLRAEQYDWVLDFHGILKSGIWTRVTGAPVRVGYEAAGNRGWGSREGNRFFTNHRVAVPAHRLSRFERNALLARNVWSEILSLDPADYPAPPPGALLPVSEAVQGEIDRFLTAASGDGDGWGRKGATVAIHPGSSPETAYKRWFSERYGQLADALMERGHRVIFTSGPGERDAVEAILENMKGPALVAPETPTLQHLAAVFQRCQLFIGNDTGPMHIAALSGKPVVAVFGPTDPIENAPYPGVPSAVVRKDVACHCPKRRCLTRACFDAVGVEDVLDAALGLLAAA
jgi:ADP-heptose:LPS heptosyltransferase